MTQLFEIAVALFEIAMAFSWGYILLGSWPVGLACWLATGGLAGYLAWRKNRDYWFWGVFAGFFWGPGFVALAFLKPLPRPAKTDEETEPT
ncbi:MAG: hypothetical protein RLY93_20180 [Sumerlaeia bacterium]